MSKKEKTEKGKETKVETFNSLDERFQLTPEHDDDHIFPGEYELIAELRKRRPELENETDKFLCIFLFARRHDLEETLILLDKYLKKRKELGFDVNPPTLKDDALRKHIETGVIMNPKHAVDKHDRILHYIFIANDKPKDRPLTVSYAYGFWEAQYQIRTESLRKWRNGSTLVVDFKSFGLSNVDLSQKGIEYSKALSGLFPKRIRKVYLLNGGWLLKIIMEGAKLVLSKKLCERMELTTTENLKNVIDEEFLLKDEYNGKLPYTPHDWIETVMKDEERWSREEVPGQKRASEELHEKGGVSKADTVK